MCIWHTTCTVATVVLLEYAYSTCALRARILFIASINTTVAMHSNSSKHTTYAYYA